MTVTPFVVRAASPDEAVAAEDFAPPLKIVTTGPLLL
jgi:hypothetical protein